MSLVGCVVKFSSRRSHRVTGWLCCEVLFMKEHGVTGWLCCEVLFKRSHGISPHRPSLIHCINQDKNWAQQTECSHVQ